MSSAAGHHDTTSGQRTPAVPATMRAVVQDRYGTVEVLRQERIAVPEIDDDDVLLRVHAAGLDRGTWHLMSGRPYLLRVIGFGVRGPKNRVPGLDAAGTVVAVGPAVTRFEVGDRVFGVARGSFAEYAAAREDKLARLPQHLTFEQAAVVPVSGLIAQRGLCDVGRLQPGQKVLVTGASGGVGSYAVQLAAGMGAEVTGVCSAAKVDHVTALGAHHVLDYTSDDWADGTRRYDLILDIAGNPHVHRLRAALQPRGTAVFVGGENSGAITGMSRQFRGALHSVVLKQRLVILLARERAADYERLAQLVEAGQLAPALDRCYPLERAAHAMRRLEDGTVRGKIALTV